MLFKGNLIFVTYFFHDIYFDDTDNKLNDVGSDCLERLFACNYYMYCLPMGEREEILSNIGLIKASRCPVPCYSCMYIKRYAKCYRLEKLS